MKPVALGTECKVYHKILRYAGTSDLMCIINGRLTLVDYKTSAQVNSKLCAVQLEGYDRAWESHGVKVDDRHEAVSVQRSLRRSDGSGGR